MTDRELLEAAAKAAGIQLLWPRDPTTRVVVDGVPPRRIDTWDNWNPLTDSGNALDLAVQLGLEVGHNTFKNVIVDHYTMPRASKVVLPHGTDPYAATRRAIVRAAAAVGANLERA